MQETSDTSVPDPTHKWSIQRVVVIIAAMLTSTIVIIFVIGLLLTFSSPLEATALRLVYVRNIAIIVLFLEGLLVVGSLAVLIVQITRLINLVKKETKLLIGNAQDVVDSAKGTVEFVGDNVAQPVVQAGGIVAGARIIIRDIGGIRQALGKREESSEVKPAETSK
jgi:hypothetical protein